MRALKTDTPTAPANPSAQSNTTASDRTNNNSTGSGVYCVEFAPTYSVGAYVDLEQAQKLLNQRAAEVGNWKRLVAHRPCITTSAHISISPALSLKGDATSTAISAGGNKVVLFLVSLIIRGLSPAEPNLYIETSFEHDPHSSGGISGYSVL
jgi:hypothetical protein